MTVRAESPKPRRRRHYLRWIVVGAVLLFIFLNCSGLNFPIFKARGTLNYLLQKDFRLELPSNAVIERHARKAYRDPTYYYLLKVPSDDGQRFADQLRHAAERRQVVTEIESGKINQQLSLAAMGPPKWWRPETMDNARLFHIAVQESLESTGYYLLYSENGDRIYILWYAT
jgi:hypothetical protein